MPDAREMAEMTYEFEQPFILDCSKIERAFGLKPTLLDQSLATTVAWWRSSRA